jgi:hypothetical protein
VGMISSNRTGTADDEIVIVGAHYDTTKNTILELMIMVLVSLHYFKLRKILVSNNMCIMRYSYTYSYAWEPS